jgi:urease accessory protein
MSIGPQPLEARGVDSAPATQPRRPVPSPDAVAGWSAKLVLGFERRGERTVLAKRSHVGPLVVQKALHPEGPAVCQTIVVHPPGGVAGGDCLALDVDVAAGAHAQLTTPGAAKWYRTAGAGAEQSFRASVAAGATLEWLPQEAIIFDGAVATLATTIALAGDATFIGWDVICLGRTQSGERFGSGRLHHTLALTRDTNLLWCERTVLDGGSRALQSGAVLDGAPVFGTMIATGEIGDSTRALCRACGCADGEAAVSRMPQVLVARYRGASAPAARMYFASLWHILRPALADRRAVPPRIWNT